MKDLKLGTRRGPLLAPPPGDKKCQKKKCHPSRVILKSKKSSLERYKTERSQIGNP